MTTPSQCWCGKELGHLRLHDPTAFDMAVTRRCRGTEEVEAESVAYLIAASHGMDTGDYTFPYLAAWASHVRGATPEDVVRATGNRVMQAARTMLSQLQPDAVIASTDRGMNQRVESGLARTPDLRQTRTALADATGQSTGRIPHRKLVAVHAEAITYFHARLAGSWVPGYLERRTLLPALQEPWTAGYAPDAWTALTDHLRSRGWTDEVLEAAGLSRRASTGHLVDHFRDRLVLPIRNPAGDVVAFIGRARPDALDRVPKYLNSPATGIYCKTQTLYGLAEGGRDLVTGALPVLVEGPLDAVAVNEATAGQCSGMAPCGTALTEAQVTSLAAGVDLTARPIVVATDTDAAGTAAAVRAYDLLAPHATDVRRADLSGANDPADYVHRFGPSALLPALTDRARPLLDDVIDARIQRWLPQMQWVEGRVGAARDVAPILARLTEPQRQHHIEHVADRLTIAVETLSREVEKVSRRESAHHVGAGPSSGVLSQRASPAPKRPPTTAPTGEQSSTALPRPQSIHSVRLR